MRPKPRQRREWGVRTRHWLACSAVLITAIACEAGQTAPLAPSITIRDQWVQLEIARTEAEKAKGLGDRDRLDWGQGMLFEYSAPGFPRFWMKDMRFDIDIVWIRDFRIVDISHRVKHFPEGPGPTIRPRELVDTVLEVPAGFAQAHRWRLGDRVTLSGVAPGVPSSAP
ncbi:MAG: DUF192 domain-containing protein [Myxococcales bacterium]|nr:DUF192 domain-containing protein [Myxococcales bacterium]